MNDQDFREWRERVVLTQDQVAERFKVSRNAVQNWETGASSISEAVKNLCDIWETRLYQIRPLLGPLTLIYSSAPMFVNPQGPRQPLGMPSYEPFVTNAGAIARVQMLWGTEIFNGPFIIEASGKMIWNSTELKRVVEGDDSEAPTIANLVRMIAEEVKASSGLFVRSGPSGAGSAARRNAVNALADELRNISSDLCAGGLCGTERRLQIEALFDQLRKLGKWPPEGYVNAIAQAFVTLEMIN